PSLPHPRRPSFHTSNRPSCRAVAARLPHAARLRGHRTSAEYAPPDRRPGELRAQPFTYHDLVQRYPNARIRRPLYGGVLVCARVDRATRGTALCPQRVARLTPSAAPLVRARHARWGGRWRLRGGRLYIGAAPTGGARRLRRQGSPARRATAHARRLLALRFH